jgi:hypothetical protein
METQIAKQKKRVAALYELAEVDDEGPPPLDLVQGITDACRTVFLAAEKPLYPIDVKNGVEALGLPPQQNLLASVNTVIRRLLAANEIEEVNPVGGSGPVGYRVKNWALRMAIGIGSEVGTPPSIENTVQRSEPKVPRPPNWKK